MIQVYSHKQTGAPQLTGTALSLRGVLDAVLINGFNLRAPDSITQVDGVGSASFSIAHDFAPGEVVEFSGADQAEYNNKFLISNVTPNRFEFSLAETAPATATGSLTVKIAPQGNWERPFFDVEQSVYRAQSGNRHYLKLNEYYDTTSSTYQLHSGYRQAKCHFFEEMTSLDTGIGGTSNNVYLRKSVSTSSTYFVPWYIVASDTTFFVFIDWSCNGDYDVFGFGEIKSWVENDLYSTFLAGASYPSSERGVRYYRISKMRSEWGVNTALAGVNTYMWILRDWTSTTVAPFRLTSLRGGTSEIGFGSSLIPVFNPPDGARHFLSTYLLEHNCIRGSMPHFLGPLAADSALPKPALFHNVMINDTPRSVLSFGKTAIDITGPWT